MGEGAPLFNSPPFILTPVTQVKPEVPSTVFQPSSSISHQRYLSAAVGTSLPPLATLWTRVRHTLFSKFGRR